MCDRIKLYQKNIDIIKQTYLYTTINNLTINEIYFRDKICWCRCKCACGKEVELRLTNVTHGRNKSCGCLILSEVASKRGREFWKNNPDKVAERAIKYHEWCINNNNKVKEKSKKVSLFYKEHPEAVEHNGIRISEWYKNNPDKVANRIRKFKQWCKDNPDVIRDKISLYQVEKHKKNRIDSITDEMLSVIHHDDICKLQDGEFYSGGSLWIRSKCPNCGNYDYHPVANVIKFNSKSVKLPLCKLCQGYYTSSKPEQGIYDYISTFYNGECIRNSRDIISPFELDLYYPEKKIAVEFNGMYWHNEDRKTYDYHYSKFIKCKEYGIRLISVFEQDWLFKHNAIKLVLQDAFSDHIKLSARKCLVCKLSYNDKSCFISKYHFDGDSVQGTIAYGLFYNNELISCMSFGKLRGQNSLCHKECHYELVRYVTKSCVTVIGGAAKLLSHFIKDYDPRYILSYSDNDLFTGSMYKLLGFSMKSSGNKSIDYQWCNTNEVLSRQQCMPFRLLKKYPLYKDMHIDGSKEKFIMSDLGYYKIYRRGNSIWEWRNAL